MFLLLAGFFLPAVAIILMSMPWMFGCDLRTWQLIVVILPVLTQTDINLVWFGVVLTINEIGLIHPPVGLNIFVIRGVAPEIPLHEVMWGVLPFVIIMMLFIVLLVVVPQIATWLPDLLMGKAL